MIRISSIEGFEDIKDTYYMFKRSNSVLFKNKNTKKFIKPFKKKGKLNGYMYLKLATKDNKFRNIRIHRLIASAFIENEDSFFDEVHHRDNNRANNKINNLEWTDRKGNMFYVFNYDNENYLDGEDLPIVI